MQTTSPSSSAARDHLSVSDDAARRLVTLSERENRPTLMLRITVSGGGCAGFQYVFTLDDSARPDESIFTTKGAQVVTDPTSLDLLKGAEVDFVEDLNGAYFRLNNPNALSSCGCGASFSV